MVQPQKVIVELNSIDRRNMERIANALEKHNRQTASTPTALVSDYDENTMTKVKDAMARTGLNQGQILDVVTELQNVGILFRENKTY